MESNRSSQTAYGAAYARLLEQYEPKETRLFEDSFVKSFFSSLTGFLMRFDALRRSFAFMYGMASIGILGLQVCRTKYIDGILREAIQNGMQQLVILGAGFDTRPYRMAGSDEMKIFEVDLPDIQGKKKNIMKKCLGALPDNIIYAAIDFNVQTLENVLTDQGLDLSKPVLFIWEGVTQYITGEAVDNTMKFISKASPESEIVFTYILKSVIDGTSNIAGAESLTNLLEMGNASWSFGLEPRDVSDFLKQYGLELIEDIGVDYYQKNYLEPIGRNLDVSPIERLVHARVI